MTVYDGGKVSPAVNAAGDEGDIGGPALIGDRGSALHFRLRGTLALVQGLFLGLHDAVDRLLVNEQFVSEAQHGPEPSVSVGKVFGGQFPDALH